MKIVFTTGGSGGHIYPVIAIIREIRRMQPDSQIWFIGTKVSYGLKELKDLNVNVLTIQAGKFRRYITPKSLIQNFVDLFRIPLGIIKSFFLLKKIKPDLVFGKGGYGSVPVILAANKLKIPIYIHESDTIPGKATKIGVKYASKIFTSFDKAQGINNSIIVGNPIRKELLKGDNKKAIEYFDLQNDKPIIFIVGGSQGAERINNLVLQVLTQLLEKYEIIHQCGKKSVNEVNGTAQVMVKDEKLFKYYHAYGYFNEEQLRLAMNVSHLIVSRAGGGFIFEIAALGKPSILIPLPESAQNHQAKNAYEYGKNGAAIVMEPKNPTPRLLLQNITKVFSDPIKLSEMKKAAIAFSKIDSAEKIAQEILK